MSHHLAYAIFRIRQRQARNLSEQHDLERLFLTFVGGEISPEDYERRLAPAAPESTSRQRTAQ